MREGEGRSTEEETKKEERRRRGKMKKGIGKREDERAIRDEDIGEERREEK